MKSCQTADSSLCLPGRSSFPTALLLCPPPETSIFPHRTPSSVAGGRGAVGRGACMQLAICMQRAGRWALARCGSGWSSFSYFPHLLAWEVMGDFPISPPVVIFLEFPRLTKHAPSCDSSGSPGGGSSPPCQLSSSTRGSADNPPTDSLLSATL